MVIYINILEADSFSFHNFRYDDAEDAATSALQYEPKNVKARFRRGMARKGMDNLKAALAGRQSLPFLRNIPIHFL